MLLFCSPLISEQVFFLYINPTCTHTHSVFCHCLWSTRLQPCKWAREMELQQDKTRYNRGCFLLSVFIMSHALVQRGKVHHCATVWDSIADLWLYIYLKHWDNDRLSGCFHSSIAWSEPEFSFSPILQQVSFQIALLGLNHINLCTIVVYYCN